MEEVSFRCLFLRCMCFIYFAAFTSMYYQIPGLYGPNGLLPVNQQLQACADEHPKCARWSAEHQCSQNPSYMLRYCRRSCEVCTSQDVFHSRFLQRPTLLWLAKDLGLELSRGMEVICLLGMMLSFVCLLWSSYRGPLTIALLWLSYLSIYQVGQVFLSFQWDGLLLETGFLLILIAVAQRYVDGYSGEAVTQLLVRWLLFRLMFASGVVKFQSRCPQWWGLSAIEIHYMSQCIPTPIAWYLYQLPTWFHRLSGVITFMIEIGNPLLFFVPIRSVRIMSFVVQVILQVCILASGNFNFFNLITLCLCLSLLDDSILNSWFGSEQDTRKQRGTSPLIDRMVLMFVFVMIAVVLTHFFHVRLNEDLTVSSEIAFTLGQLTTALRIFVPITIGLASVEFLCASLLSLCDALRPKTWLTMLSSVIKTTVLVVAGGGIFLSSLVPYTELEPGLQQRLWPAVWRMHDRLHPLHVSNAYGLFRTMTGAGGRPELIIEGSHSENGPWSPYTFLYKVGEVGVRPPFVAPHQPRLDWQMWFEALNNDEQASTWFYHLLGALLSNREEVLRLMGPNPFPKDPPKFVRILRYKYVFTTISANDTFPYSGIQDWWMRDRVEPYLGVFTLDKPFRDYLSSTGFQLQSSPSGSPSFMFAMLDRVRTVVDLFNPTAFILTPVVVAYLKQYI